MSLIIRFLFLGWIHLSLRFLPCNPGLHHLAANDVTESITGCGPRVEVGMRHPSHTSVAQTHTPKAVFIPTSV